jgi:hypothetical protein
LMLRACSRLHAICGDEKITTVTIEFHYNRGTLEKPPCRPEP